MSPAVRTGGAAGVVRRPERPHPRDQLDEGERLGQVVVGAEREARDLVLDRAARGQHDHPGEHALVGELAADLVAGHARQVAVEHDDVVARQRRLAVAVVAVERDVDRHALAAEAACDRLGQLGFVLDYQYPHSQSPR